MSNDDVTWWKPSSQDRNQNRQPSGTEIPGDTDAADIVGRTGEEMPEVAHDEGRPDPHVTRQDTPVLPGVDAQDPDSMPRAEDDEVTRQHSPEFHDRPGSGSNIADRHRVFDNVKAAGAGRPGEAIEGQLGPDELSDPVEVIMNQEAKLHH
jgi:hypothetical protein